MYDRYGPAPKNFDSAVNILVDVVKDQSGKQYKMDHYAVRYPTNVLDIGKFLEKISGMCPCRPPERMAILLQEGGVLTALLQVHWPTFRASSIIPRPRSSRSTRFASYTAKS